MNDDDKTVSQLGNELVMAASNANSRLDDQGRVLGWRGFHIDLDRVEELTEALRMRVRGIPSPQHGTDPGAKT